MRACEDGAAFMRVSCVCAYRVGACGGAGGRGGWGIYILNQIHFESFSSCQVFTYCGSPVKL